MKRLFGYGSLSGIRRRWVLYLAIVVGLVVSLMVFAFFCVFTRK